MIDFSKKTTASDRLLKELYCYNSNKRWKIETGGILFNNLMISTDDRSKIMISGARVAAQNDNGFTTQWKVDSGFVKMNSDDVISISDAVLKHISFCFSKEDEIATKISNGIIKSTQQIDEEWLM